MTKLRELERRLKEEPDNLGLRVAVAGELRELGRLGDAVELYRSVALAYRDQGRPQQAIAVCRSVLELAPDDGRCRELLAVLGGGGGAAAAAAAAAAPSAIDAEPPPRRSWTDETPLPPALPYHIADPTSRLRLPSELPTTEDAPTRPGSSDAILPEVSGIANAARRISATLIGVRISADAEISVDLEADEPEIIEEASAVPRAHRPTGQGGAGAGAGAVVAAADADAADDDDQTRPRDLPMGLRRPWPPVHPSPAARAVAPAHGAAAPWPDEEETRTPMPSPLSFAFFKAVPAERRAAVLARFSRRSVPAGTVVIRRGEASPTFVLIARGRLEVRGDRGGAVIDLGALGPGEHIGEAPLLGRTPARASVVAATEAELLLLTPRDFYDIAAANPPLWAALKEAGERRNREHEALLAGAERR